MVAKLESEVEPPTTILPEPSLSMDWNVVEPDVPPSTQGNLVEKQV